MLSSGLSILSKATLTRPSSLRNPTSLHWKPRNGTFSNSLPSQLASPITSLYRSRPVSIKSTSILGNPRSSKNPLITRHYSTERQEKPDIEVQKEFRNHLKSFLMRVHPDFFSKHPKIQEENDRGLKQLNSLLDMVEEYSKKPSGPILLDRTRVAVRISTTFYLRSGPKTLAESKAEEKRKERESKMSETEKKERSNEELFPPPPGASEYPSISSSLTLPESYFTTPFSRDFLERDVRIFLNDLLKQAGLPTMAVSDEDMNFARARFSADSQEISEQFENDGTYKPRSSSNPYRDAQALRKEFKHILGAFLDRHFPDAQMAIDKLGPDWEMQVGHKPEAYIAMGVADLHHSTDRERKQIHYEPSLDGEERAHGLLLVEELWSSGLIPNDIPVFITRDANSFLKPDALPGFISVPLEFENAVFQQYLKDNLRTIMIARYNLRGQLLETESLMRQFAKTLKLTRIEPRTSLEHTAVCIAAINEVKEYIFRKHKKDLEGMTWQIVEAGSISEFTRRFGGSDAYIVPDTKKQKKKESNDKQKDDKKEAASEVQEKKGEKEEKEEDEEKEIEIGGSGYELEAVEGLDTLKRRKLDLSPEYLAKMASIRAQKAKEISETTKGAAMFSDDWEDEAEEAQDAVLDELEHSILDSASKIPETEDRDLILEEIESEWRKSLKFHEIKPEIKKKSHENKKSDKNNDLSEDASEADEFEQEMMKEQSKQAEKLRRELVHTEGTPMYSLRRDVLLIPWNTTGEAFLEFLETNAAILHFRQKIYPGKEWRTKMRLVCKTIRFLLGVESVAFSGRTIWDKSVQVTALKNLEKLAPIIRNTGLKDFKVVVTQQSIGVNLKKKTLRVPHNLTPKLWVNFLKSLSEEAKKPRVHGSKRFIGKTVHL